MDITGFSNSPVTPAPARSGARYTADAAEKISRGLALAAVVSDEAGKYSESERYAAYDKLFASGVTGQFAGANAEDMKVFEHALDKSKTVQRVRSVLQEATNKMVAASAAGADPIKTLLDFNDALSAADQKALFANINPSDMRGNRRYESAEGWRGMLLAIVKVNDYLGKADSPAFVEAEGARFSHIRAMATNAVQNDAWGRALLKLFDEPVDRVDLSHEAKGTVGAASVNPAPKNTFDTASGSLFDARV